MHSNRGKRGQFTHKHFHENFWLEGEEKERERDFSFCLSSGFHLQSFTTIATVTATSLDFIITITTT